MLTTLLIVWAVGTLEYTWHLNGEQLGRVYRRLRGSK